MNDKPTANPHLILNHVELAADRALDASKRIRAWADEHRDQHGLDNDGPALSDLRDRLGFVIETILRPGPEAVVRDLANDMVRITEALDALRQEETS